MIEAPRGELECFFAYVTSVLERLGIPYMVVGGFAATVYGVPRLTMDVDVVVDMQWEQVQPLVRAFPSPDYYVSEETVRDSLRRGYPFNIIESATAAKLDVVPMPTDPFTRKAFSRRREVVFDELGNRASFIAAEDIVVAKLLACQATESDKHLRDAQGVLVMQWAHMDRQSLRETARAVGVDGILQAARLDLADETTLNELE
jgi:hypothetical protein